MRKPLIAGNWKLNKNSHEAMEFVTLLERELNDVLDVDIVVCPPFTALADVREVLIDSNIGVGAQNLYWEDSGAFTGEVSAPMIKDLGVLYVIIGHSERRQYFGETNAIVHKKIKAALKYQLVPIVCIGERLEEREANKTTNVVTTQCEECFKGLSADEMKKIIVAYEPVWAIGTGKNATPEQAQEIHSLVRGLIAKMFSQEVSNVVRILYGGSVKPENISELMLQGDIDGALVGGASLQLDSFAKIVKNSSATLSKK